MNGIITWSKEATCPFCGDVLSEEDHKNIEKQLEKKEHARIKHCRKTLFSVALQYDGSLHSFIR